MTKVWKKKKTQTKIERVVSFKTAVKRNTYFEGDKTN